MTDQRKKISATMYAALSLANDHGGILVRFPGGWWSWHGVGIDRYRNPVEHASTRTIEALVARGRMQFIDWKIAWSGRVRRRRRPTVVQLTNMDETLNRKEASD
jgi:hypothetical protein